MRRSLAGDQAAYRVLLVDLTRHLRSYFARRLGDRGFDAEDLVQDTLMAIHTRRATYDTNRPFTAWIHAIARYKLIDHMRQRHRRAEVPIEDADALLAPAEQEAASARMDVDRLLDTIPKQQSELIRQVRIKGDSVASAATRMGMSETAAKVSIHRAVRSLGLRFGKGKPSGDE